MRRGGDGPAAPHDLSLLPLGLGFGLRRILNLTPAFRPEMRPSARSSMSPLLMGPRAALA